MNRVSILFCLCCILILLRLQTFAQGNNLTVTGTIKDQNNNSLSGITISEKGKSNSVATDANGIFKIVVASKGAKLVISGVGFETQIISAAGGSFQITLTQSNKSLQEVTVVGYSTKKKEQISSAVSVISGDKLRDVTSNEITSLLQGKAPGVVVSTGSGDPTTASNVIIRGAGTINASTSPLYVVDGNIGGSFNPTDVESVTVLKDAAATGLYGSRAANGVIIVTTKSGKAGRNRIEFNGTAGFSEATTGHFKLMNTQQLYDYQKTFYNPDPSVLKTNTDWWDLAFRRGVVNSHQLAASGGNDKTQYYVSGSYYKEQGTLINNDKTSYNLRTNLTQKITDNLRLGVLLNGKFSKDNYNPEGTLYDAYVNLPFDSAFNADGTPKDARFGTWYGRDRDNFLHGLQYNFSKARSFNMNGDVNIDYTFLKDFTVSTYNRATLFNLTSNSYYDKRSKGGATNNGEVYNSSSYSSTLLSSNRLRYNHNFGLHGISALAVAEIQKGYSDNISTSEKNLPPGRSAPSTATDIITNPSGGQDEYIFSKYLGQIDYSFSGKYFVVASLVNEYSSRFGKNNPSADFYQLGGSWVISKEPFMSKLPAIGFLKLRASYGTTGNAEGIGFYASMGLYTISTNASYSGLPGAAPSQKSNPDLTWEKAKTTNIGFDLTLLKRIDLSVDVYNKTTSSLLFFRALPATTGYSGVYENVGSIRNRGIEFNLTTRNITTKNFSWETNLNMAFNKNKVLELNQGRTEVSTGARQPIGLGRDMDEWYMPVWVGVDPSNGNPLWQSLITDADGKNFVTYTSNYNLATRQYIGKSSAPKFTGGFTNSVTYKSFTLSAFFNFVYGNYVYNDSRFFFDNDGLYESYNQMQLAKGWSRWQKPGDIATHPKPIHGRSDASNATSTRYLEDGSYVRLRNVTLGYNVASSLLNKLHISNARIFLSGDNLWTGTSFTGPDPEVVLGSGISSIKYPISRKILLGLNISL